VGSLRVGATGIANPGPPGPVGPVIGAPHCSRMQVEQLNINSTSIIYSNVHWGYVVSTVYASADASTPTSCVRLCQRDPNCVSWSWTFAVCELSTSSTPLGTGDALTLWGDVNRSIFPAVVITYGSQILGATNGLSTTQNKLALCQQQCQFTSNCGGFNYYPATHRCDTFASSGFALNQAPNNTIISGVVTTERLLTSLACPTGTYPTGGGISCPHLFVAKNITSASAIIENNASDDGTGWTGYCTESPDSNRNGRLVNPSKIFVSCCPY